VNDAEKLELCKKAIFHVLIQIQERAEVRYVLGEGTESFSRLCAAYAAIKGAAPETVPAFIRNGYREKTRNVIFIEIDALANELQMDGMTAEEIRDVLSACGFEGSDIEKTEACRD
jgi:hypothetical protein